jgi:tRNA(fMet)-specific endonuclease VapC
MTRYLLDTNVLSEPLRVEPDPHVLQQLRQHAGDCALAAVAWHELWFGCMQLRESARRRKIEDYLLRVIQPSLPILAYDAEAAAWHAQERARLKTIGRIPPFADGQIAAIAVTQNLVLVTFNAQDFQQFTGLRLESWRDQSE